ncbi:MAG TPA: hypothetical protein VGM54_06755 [Chthoniobacter sp.]|jgi:hypothetical protein
MNESPLPSPLKSRPQIHPLVWLGAALVLIALVAWMVIGGQMVHPKHAVAQTTPTPAPSKLPPVELTASAPALPSEKSLALGPITSEDVADDNSSTSFVLHIPIKALPGAQIDAKALVIHVLFYDLVDGTRVAPTTANVSSRWATPPPDWEKSDTQRLDVSYRLPKVDPHLDPPPEGNHRFYGYLVRVYYRNHLQDTTATPERLAQNYPSPAILPAAPKDQEPSEPSSFNISTPKPPNSPGTTPAPTPGAYAGSPMLDLFPVKVDKIADANATKHLLLHIPIKAKRGSPIEVKDVVIHVLFYDIVDAKKVVQTNAEVKTRWATTPVDWIQSEVEELEAEYILPKSNTNGAPPSEAHDYYGYIVRVYYKGNLQAASADPERLAQEYPPPPTITEGTSSAIPASKAVVVSTAGASSPAEDTKSAVSSKPEAPATNSSPPGAADGTPQDFATHARKMREDAIENMEPKVTAPTTRTLAASGRYPWKTQIVTTMFAVGYGKKGHVHKASVWDPQWLSHYGGIDSPNPAKRHNFISTDFVPRENPFYIALPYNDVAEGATKPEAKIVIPWFKAVTEKGNWTEGQTICRHRWLAIRSAAGRVCYAQWSDSGPFTTDHWQYVFGNEKPRPNPDGGAGLQVSPAVRDYLELSNVDVTDWKFVEAQDVPDGPWKTYGEHGAHAPSSRGHGPILMAGAPSSRG